jgi:superfamily I DNA/RNA helicase
VVFQNLFLEHPMSDRTWTVEQSAIFSAIADTQDNLTINAVAGAGKTTTAVEGARLAGEDVGFAAFNTHIVGELKTKLPETATAATMHSYGLRLLGSRFGSTVQEHKARNALIRLRPSWHFASRKSGRLCLEDKYNSVLDIVSMMKQQGFNEETTSETIDAEALRQGIELPDGKIGESIRLAAVELYTDTINDTDGVDFDDMIAMPIRHGLLTFPIYKTMMIDEAQDLNPAQQQLALALAERKIIIGDPRQAIMAFAGADSNSFHRLRDGLGATEFPLSVCWRCPGSHLALAQKLVPKIMPSASAIDGDVGEKTQLQLIHYAKPGDMVICRNNAPLISLAYKMIAAGKPAYVRGRKIGEGIQLLVRKLRPKTLMDLSAKVDQWRAQQVEIAKEKTPHDSNAGQQFEDRADCVMTLIQVSRDLEHLKTQCASLFADTNGGRITLSSIHRSKGLEADTVWFYEPGLCPSSPDFQELNLLYVALTRAKKSLWFVDHSVRRLHGYSEWVSKVAAGRGRKQLASFV